MKFLIRNFSVCSRTGFFHKTREKTRDLTHVYLHCEEKYVNDNMFLFFVGVKICLPAGQSHNNTEEKIPSMYFC